jgi:hypothetical protein
MLEIASEMGITSAGLAVVGQLGVFVDHRQRHADEKTRQGSTHRSILDRQADRRAYRGRLLVTVPDFHCQSYLVGMELAQCYLAVERLQPDEAL